MQNANQPVALSEQVAPLVQQAHLLQAADSNQSLKSAWVCSYVAPMNWIAS